MESGTILHLALLKKLCSGSPKFNYLNKFKTFRSVKSHQSHRTACSPQTPQTSRQLFQKYPKSHRELNFIRTKSHSLDEKATMYNNSKHLLQQSMNLCGWNVQNEEEYNYDKFLKRNNYPLSTLQFKASKKQSKRQSKPIKQKKFTYCEKDIDQFFKLINIPNTNSEQKRNESRKQKNARLKPLIIQEVETQSNIPPSKPIYADKQNLLSEQLQLISTHKVRKLRKKSNAHNVNDLVREWNIELNRKRIC